MRVIDLRVENQKRPISVDAKKPVFSWRVETEKENWFQGAYRLQVWREKNSVKEIVWDSGFVKSGRMNQIEYEGVKLISDTRYYWNVEIFEKNSQKRAESDSSWFETGLFEPTDWQGKWIGDGDADEYHLFRKGFYAEKEILSAKWFVCGLGQHECFMNGKRVTDAVLEPGWTDYHKSCMYSAYDVTKFVKRGENGLCVKLGDGMYHVPGGRYVYYDRSYGKRKLLAKLRLRFTDGSEQEIVTDESWMMGPSPLKFCCIYGGEDYDGRVAMAQVSEPEFVMEKSWQSAVVMEASNLVLRAASIPPLRVMQTYTPAAIKKLDSGAFLYDFGKNFSGWVRITVNTKGQSAGQKIVMTPGEILGADNRPDQRVTGRGYAWTYICNDEKKQVFAPDFTYTGFRYVMVEGASPKGVDDELPVIETLIGEFIYPDMEETGTFNCSNELFNQIHQIIKQAMLSNIKSYFTDCPHREKLPWLEETHLIGPAMLCNWDLQCLYEKIEQDMADAQRENGLVADICPEYVTGFDRWHKGFVDSPEWGSACVLNPWHLYCKYGNIRVLKQWYPTMKRYVDYLTSKTWHGVLHHGLGDWLDIGPCTPYSQNTPVPITATCIYYIDLTIMQQVAAMFGYQEDEKRYAEQRALVYEEYNRQFLDDQTGRYANGSQACQAMSLMAGLVPEANQEKAVRQLKDEVVKRKFAITAGDVGHPYLVAALMTNGMSDILNQMTNITETPGYGYQVVNGATTLTEEWDGPNPEHPHGSQNHLMLGSIDEWFFAGLAGIGSIRTQSQFDKVVICPHIADGIDCCSASVMHPYGKLSVSWERVEEKVKVQLVIPPNVTATFMSEDKTVNCEFGSGTYEVTIER